MIESRYFATGAEFQLERARLSLLESNCDPATVERLARVGVAPGWRCLEVAAGGGSVACWLARRVGPSGTVTATDVDTRFLTARDLPQNVEVRRHDIDADPLEADAYDLVHSRALVEHLPDPRHALERMAAALRPGGWLVIEAADFTPLRSAWPEHASSSVFDRVARAFVDSMLADGIMDLLMAPRLPLLLERLGLVQVDNDGVAGDRLVLTTNDVESLLVIEVDARGDPVGTIRFDPGDRQAAYDELDARYAKGEASEHPALWQTLAHMQRALAARDWGQLARLASPDLVAEDHRPLGWGTARSPQAYAAAIRPIPELRPDVAVRFEHLLLADRAVLFVASWIGSDAGRPFAIPLVVVFGIGRNGRIQRAHHYNLEQLATARARFAERCAE